MVPPNDSKFWGIIQMVVLGAIFIIGANTLYDNGWAMTDWVQLIALLTGSGAVTMLRSQFVGRPPQ